MNSVGATSKPSALARAMCAALRCADFMAEGEPGSMGQVIPSQIDSRNSLQSCPMTARTSSSAIDGSAATGVGRRNQIDVSSSKRRT